MSSRIVRDLHGPRVKELSQLQQFFKQYAQWYPPKIKKASVNVKLGCTHENHNTLLPKELQTLDPGSPLGTPTLMTTAHSCQTALLHLPPYQPHSPYCPVAPSVTPF